VFGLGLDWIECRANLTHGWKRRSFGYKLAFDFWGLIFYFFGFLYACSSNSYGIPGLHKKSACAIIIVIGPVQLTATTVKETGGSR